MTQAATEELGEFFDYIWSDTHGFVYLPVQDPAAEREWTGYMFEWPRQRAGVVRHVLKHAANSDANVFFSPAIFSRASAKKDAVKGSWVLWVDFDGNAPKDWSELPVPEPTLVIQSSQEGHEHCYWRLDEFLDTIPMLEDRNRSLAYTLKADTSGWDADQILRPPFTINRKRNLPVTIKGWVL